MSTLGPQEILAATEIAITETEESATSENNPANLSYQQKFENALAEFTGPDLAELKVKLEAEVQGKIDAKEKGWFSFGRSLIAPAVKEAIYKEMYENLRNEITEVKDEVQAVFEQADETLSQIARLEVMLAKTYSANDEPSTVSSSVSSPALTAQFETEKTSSFSLKRSLSLSAAATPESQSQPKKHAAEPTIK